MKKRISTISLERGWWQGSEGSGNLRIVAIVGEASKVVVSDGLLLLIHWRRSSCTVRFFVDNLERSLLVERKGDAIECILGSEIGLPDSVRIRVSSCRSDWSQAPVFNISECAQTQTFFVSPCGIEDGQWVDGWMGHLSEQGEFYSFIPAGGNARILTQVDIAGARGIPAVDVFGAMDQVEINRQCIVTGLQKIFEHRVELPLKIEDKSRDEALAAVLWAQAFPTIQLRFTSDVPKKMLPRPWKGLIGALAAKYTELGSFDLSLKEVLKHVPQHARIDLFKYVNRPTRIFDYREWRSDL